MTPGFIGLIYKYTRSLRSLLSKKFGDFSHHYIFNGQTVSIRGTVKGELLLIHIIHFIGFSNFFFSDYAQGNVSLKSVSKMEKLNYG